MKKILLCVSAAVMLLTACDKDDEEPENVTPSIQNLTGNFRLTGATLSGQNIFDNANGQNLYDACERDDNYNLATYSAPATSGTLTMTDQGTKCSPDGSYVSDWSFTGPSTLVLDGNTWTISSYNGTTLQLTQTFQGATWTETYTKQ